MDDGRVLRVQVVHASQNLAGPALHHSPSNHLHLANEAERRQGIRERGWDHRGDEVGMVYEPASSGEAQGALRLCSNSWPII